MTFDLRKFAKDIGVNQTKIGEVLGGIDQSQVSFMMNGRRRVLPSHIEMLRKEFGNVVDSYFVEEPAPTPRTATMTPYPEPTPQQTTSSDVVVATVAADGEVQVVEQPPFVPDSVVRKPEINVMEWVENEESDHSQSAFNIASILRRTKFVIQMNNNAMAPDVAQGDYLFLKPFPEGAEIIDGEAYGIETRSHGILFRFLYDAGDAILARPKNTRDFGDLRIPKDQIIRKYFFVFRGSTHLSSMPDNDGERDKQIKQQGEQINALIRQVGVSMAEISKAGERTDKLLEQNKELFQLIIKRQ